MKLDPIVVNVKPTLDPGSAKAFRDMAAALTAFVDALTPTDGPEDCAEPHPLTAGDLDALVVGATVADDDGDPWTKQVSGHWTYLDGGLIETNLRLVHIYGPIRLVTV